MSPKPLAFLEIRTRSLTRATNRAWGLNSLNTAPHRLGLISKTGIAETRRLRSPPSLYRSRVFRSSHTCEGAQWTR